MSDRIENSGRDGSLTKDDASRLEPEAKRVLALQMIISYTEGYDEYGMPLAFLCNLTAKLGLGMDVSSLLHNHDDDNFHKNCQRCKKLMADWDSR